MYFVSNYKIKVLRFYAFNKQAKGDDTVSRTLP